MHVWGQAKFDCALFCRDPAKNHAFYPLHLTVAFQMHHPVCLVMAKNKPNHFLYRLLEMITGGLVLIRDIWCYFLAPQSRITNRSCSAWCFHLSAIITHFLFCKNEIILILMHVVRIFFLCIAVFASLLHTDWQNNWDYDIINTDLYAIQCICFSVRVSENESSVNNKTLEMEAVSKLNKLHTKMVTLLI